MDPELCTGLQGLQSWYVAVLADVAEKCRFAESESEGYTYASSILPVAYYQYVKLFSFSGSDGTWYI